MTYASNNERLEMVKSLNGLEFVVRIKTWRGESELPADDFEHACDMATSWKHVHGAEYVEIFRVDQQDGSLFGGIGSF